MTQDWPSAPLFIGSEHSSYLLEIRGEDGQWLVRVDSKGTVTYGVGYDPDLAARRFWEAMAFHASRDR